MGYLIVMPLIAKRAWKEEHWPIPMRPSRMRNELSLFHCSAEPADSIWVLKMQDLGPSGQMISCPRLAKPIEIGQILK